MVRFNNLRYLELKCFKDIEGNCLLDMKINQLSHIDLTGSFNLNPKVILHLLSGQYQNLETLNLRGSKLKQEHYKEMLNKLKKINSLKSFKLYHAPHLEDEFFLQL